MFLQPPAKQWIVFHPSVVIENVADALDGSNTQEGVMLEFVGLNWWQRARWYQLSGASLVGLYSDRPEVDDVGYGVALHFGNKLTVGMVDHDGADGFFVSIDVLEFYKDKRSVYDQYVGELAK